jgi:UDP-N-acetylmuramyl pentapeptide phosphotransferase/UDP-N-acetylglucosamine-1-phosphate transferase
MATVLPGLLAFLLVAAGHLLALKLFPALKLLDRPEKYGLKRFRRLPYPTGIVSVLVFLAIFLAITPTTTQVMGFGLGLGLLAIVSFFDDLRGLPWSLRLGVQVLIALLIFATGSRIYTITNPFGGIVKLDTVDVSLTALSSQLAAFTGPLPLWSGVFTVLWIVLTTNAFNWFDGIPGQINILAFIGSATLGLLALSSRVNQPEVALLAFLAAGCALGGVLFDFPPNKVVLGDTGAMFFGFLLGALSIYAGGKVATAFLVLGLPLIDAVFVLIRRIVHNESPFSRNLDHLHHRLLKKGWTERQVIALTVALGTAFGVTALFLETLEKFVAGGILGVIVLGLTLYSRR